MCPRVALYFDPHLWPCARVGVFLRVWGNFGGTSGWFLLFVLVSGVLCVFPLAPLFTNPQVIVYLRVLLFVLVEPDFRSVHGCAVVFICVRTEGNVKGTHGTPENLGQNHHKT